MCAGVPQRADQHAAAAHAAKTINAEAVKAPAQSQQQQQQAQQLGAAAAPGRHGPPTKVCRSIAVLRGSSSRATAPAAAAAPPAAGGGRGGGGNADDPSPSKSHGLCSKAQQATAARSSCQQSAGAKRRLLQPSGKQKQSSKQARAEDMKAEAGKADMKAAAGGKDKGAAAKKQPKGTSGGSAAAPEAENKQQVQDQGSLGMLLCIGRTHVALPGKTKPTPFLYAAAVVSIAAQLDLLSTTSSTKKIMLECIRMLHVLRGQSELSEAGP